MVYLFNRILTLLWSGCCEFIFIIIIQHSHACKNNCDVFYGREEELEAMHKYIVGPSQKVTEFYDDVKSKGDRMKKFAVGKIEASYFCSHLSYLVLEELGSLPC